jgi:hypothetical protein
MQTIILQKNVGKKSPDANSYEFGNKYVAKVCCTTYSDDFFRYFYACGVKRVPL